MPQPERFEVLILGSGAGGKLLAWHLARHAARFGTVAGPVAIDMAKVRAQARYG